MSARSGIARASLVVLGLATAVAVGGAAELDAAAHEATAADAAALVAAEPAPAWWTAVGPAGGAMSLDRDLADYRWDTTPSALWGLRAVVGRGGLATGLRAWRTRTTQGTGLPGEVAAPTVRLTGVDWLGLARVVSRGGFELWATAQAGRVRLSYDPDRISFDPGGAGAPIEVDYAPLSEWNLGLGAELRRQLARNLSAALQVERTSFALDTSHRRGDAIVTGRDRFDNWSAQLQLAWRWGLPGSRPNIAGVH